MNLLELQPKIKEFSVSLISTNFRITIKYGVVQPVLSLANFSVKPRVTLKQNSSRGSWELNAPICVLLLVLGLSGLVDPPSIYVSEHTKEMRLVQHTSKHLLLIWSDIT